MTSANIRHQGSALLLTAVTATTSPIQGWLFQPGQTYILLGRKEDSPGAPQSLLHHLDVTVAKRSGKTSDRSGWTASHPPNQQGGFACPTPTPKRGQRWSSSFAHTSSWQVVPWRSNPRLVRSLLTLSPKQKESQEPSREWENSSTYLPLTTSDFSKCQMVIMKSKLPRVSWNRFPSRAVLSTSLEAFKRPDWIKAKATLSGFTASPTLSRRSDQRPEVPAYVISPGILLCLTFSFKPMCCWPFTIQTSKSSQALQGFQGQFTTKAQWGTLLQQGRSPDQGPPNGPCWTSYHKQGW